MGGEKGHFLHNEKASSIVSDERIHRSEDLLLFRTLILSSLNID